MEAVKIPRGFKTKDFAKKGQEVYESKYKRDLESRYKGKIVAIEPDSSDFFIGDSVLDAAAKAKKVHPDKVFHFIRIGYKAVHMMR